MKSLALIITNDIVLFFKGSKIIFHFFPKFSSLAGFFSRISSLFTFSRTPLRVVLLLGAKLIVRNHTRTQKFREAVTVIDTTYRKVSFSIR